MLFMDTCFRVCFLCLEMGSVKDNSIRSSCVSWMQSPKHVLHLEPVYQPLVTFVVVWNHHRICLFARSHNDQCSIDRSGVFAGQLVSVTTCGKSVIWDKKTTLSWNEIKNVVFNFYLCSHVGIKVCWQPFSWLSHVVSMFCMSESRLRYLVCE
jgi:hypothetical protein